MCFRATVLWISWAQSLFLLNAINTHAHEPPKASLKKAHLSHRAHLDLCLPSPSISQLMSLSHSFFYSPRSVLDMGAPWQHLRGRLLPRYEFMLWAFFGSGHMSIAMDVLRSLDCECSLRTEWILNLRVGDIPHPIPRAPFDRLCEFRLEI
jgi:hypothetical protein